jgi:succinate dehydrogenase / fumarate reductase cytochrome b subunit
MADATRAEPLFGTLVKFTMGSVGSKVVMAITGLFLWVFITGHLAGNLTVFGGRELFNAYAEALQSKPPLVWTVRILVLIGLGLHFFTAARTTQLNRAARPVPYARANKSPANPASKTMMLSGALVLAFFVYHIAHFTLRVTGPQPAGTDPYAMLVMGFQNPIIAISYIVAMVLLAAHLSHGLYSLFQHLGLSGRAWTPWVKKAALVVGYGITAGFASIPFAVLLGIVHS